MSAFNDGGVALMVIDRERRRGVKVKARPSRTVTPSTQAPIYVTTPAQTPGVVVLARPVVSLPTAPAPVAQSAGQAALADRFASANQQRPAGLPPGGWANDPFADQVAYQKGVEKLQQAWLHALFDQATSVGAPLISLAAAQAKLANDPRILVGTDDLSAAKNMRTYRSQQIGMQNMQIQAKGATPRTQAESIAWARARGELVGLVGDNASDANFPPWLYNDNDPRFRPISVPNFRVWMQKEKALPRELRGLGYADKEPGCRQRFLQSPNPQAPGLTPGGFVTTRFGGQGRPPSGAGAGANPNNPIPPSGMNPVSGNATGYNIVRYPSGMAPSSGGAYASHPFGSSPGSPPVDAPVGSIIVNPQISQGGAAAGTGVTGLGAWNPVTGNVPVGVNAGSNSFAAVAPVSFGTISPGSSVMIAPSGGPAGYDDGPSLGAWLDDRPAYARDVASWLSDTIGRNTNSIASVAPALAVLGPYGALASVALEAVAGRSAGLKQSGAPTTESAPGVPGPAPGASSASQNLNPSSTPAWLIPAIGVGALLLLSRK